MANDGTTVRQPEIDEIKDFFTFRPGQPDYVNGPSRDDHWGWLEVYPQNGYGPKPGGGFEMATVGIAQNASDATGGHAGGFNTPLSYGRAYTQAEGQDSRPEAYLEGLNFSEQWERAFDLDPDLVFITGFNEWIGGRWFSWDIQPFAFVDIFSADKSRDIEPARSWGNRGDVYYMQLVDYVRQFKGMQPADSVSGAKTIDPDNPGDWEDVSPVYRSYKGNTMHRDHPGHGPSLVLTNSSGRNDIVEARVARDTDFLYFYVETDNALSPASDPGWMRLFMDIDRDKSTGWEGYDYLLNRTSPGDSVLVEKSSGEWDWTPAGKAAYRLYERSLVLKIRKTVFGLGAEDRPDFEFKWSDNMQEEGNIMDFYVNGDVAPGARFNYVYRVLLTDDGYHYASDPKGINQGLRCRQYNGVFDTLPAFNTLKVAGTHYLSEIELPQTSATDFALDYDGFLEVPEKDEYTFSLQADRQARLLINDQPVVGATGGSGERSGTIRLMPGRHALKLEYITGEGNQPVLEIRMKSGAGSFEDLSASSLFKFNAIPGIALSFKEEQNYFSENDTVILVSAEDPDGSVAGIRIFNGDELFLEEATKDFAISSLRAGDYVLKGTVTDNDGAESESRTLEFRVREAFTVPGSIDLPDYRKGKNVIVEESDDSDGGYNIKVNYGHVDYPLEVSEGGLYSFDFRVPSSTSSKVVTVTVDGEEVAQVEVGDTGNEESWYNIIADVPLKEGHQVVGLDFGRWTTLHRLDISKSSTGLHHDINRFLQIYPNPGSGVFHLRSREPVQKLSVFDLSGKSIWESALLENPYACTLNTPLVPGIYFLRVQYMDGCSETRKLVNR